MAMASMTGFARTDSEHAGLTWSWELKSVNARGLEMRFRLPAGLEGLEPEARRRINERLSRGSVTAGLQLRRSQTAAALAVNENALNDLLALVAKYGDAPGLRPASLDGLLRVPGVVEAADVLSDEDERAALETAILASLDAAIEALTTMRRQEGAALQAVLSAQLDDIAALVQRARTLEAAQPEALKKRFADKVAEFLDGNMSLSPERLAQEVALLAAKADVREELDRLDGHIAAARKLLTAPETVGRKLDFLAQEFNREANTLCSKSADMALTEVGLELKNVIGRLREQVQNIE